MAKRPAAKLSGPDDPIYKSGLIVFTPRSAQPQAARSVDQQLKDLGYSDEQIEEINKIT